MDKALHTRLIKEKAIGLGFSFVGISKAGFLEEEATHLELWLKKGMHGKMAYMENHFDKRLDPRLLVEGAKSVVSLLLNYFPGESQNREAPAISKYAYGTDYHFVIKNKLSELLFFIRQNIGEVNGRAFVDSAPVLDKAWAKKSGIGWVGKNGNLINKNSGSFFFIAELILDLELEIDSPVEDHCGTCTRCIDACPTDAIAAPYIVDGSRCISYLTIELKESIPSEFSGKMNDWIFGCDICQDVCPWNSFSLPAKESEFTIRKEISIMGRNDWMEITEEIFKKVFKNSPLERTGFQGLKRNLEFISVKKRTPEE